MNGASLERARAAKAKVAALLANHPHLRGLGIAVLDDGFGVKANFGCAPEEGLLPADVNGVPIVIDVIGPIRAS